MTMNGKQPKVSAPAWCCKTWGCIQLMGSIQTSGKIKKCRDMIWWKWKIGFFSRNSLPQP